MEDSISGNIHMVGGGIGEKGGRGVLYDYGWGLWVCDGSRFSFFIVRAIRRTLMGGGYGMEWYCLIPNMISTRYCEFQSHPLFSFSFVSEKKNKNRLRHEMENRQSMDEIIFATSPSKSQNVMDENTKGNKSTC
jgi:hypothetical protein